MTNQANEVGHKISARQLVMNCPGLASLPKIYQELDKAVNSPNVSNFKIAQIINSDPTLAAKLLQIVNSARYNFPAVIETISHAVAIIGVAELKEIVLATSVISLTKKLPDINIDYPSFWHHSISCAINARTVASFQREKNIEQFYVAGLLHDIGSLLLMLEMPAQYQELINESQSESKELRLIEEKYLGFDHGEVGYELAKQWSLPEYIQEAIRYHHRPSEAKNYRNIVTVVHFADMMSNKSIGCKSEGKKELDIDEKYMEEMELSHEMLDSVMQSMDEQLEETLRIFSI